MSAVCTGAALGLARAESPATSAPIDLPPNAQATLPVTVENRCPSAQTFRIDPKGFPAGLVKGGEASVAANASADVPVLLETTGIPAGVYGGTIAIVCVSCGSSCRQDQIAFTLSIGVAAGNGAPETRPTSPGAPPPSAPPGGSPAPGGTAPVTGTSGGADGSPSPPASPTKRPPDNSPPPLPGPSTPPLSPPPPPPPPPPPSKEDRGDGPKPGTVPGGCCACVEGLELKLMGPVTNAGKESVVEDPNGSVDPLLAPGKDSYGHEFKIFVYYRCQRITGADELPGELDLGWFEQTHDPPAFYRKNGVKPDAETEIPSTLGKQHPEVLAKGTFGSWTHRPLCAKNCPNPPAGVLSPARLEMTDKPWVPYGKQRTMKFRIKVKSAEKCHCKHKAFEVTADQVLTGKKEDSVFHGPSGKAMKNGEVVKGTEKPE